MTWLDVVSYIGGLMFSVMIVSGLIIIVIVTVSSNFRDSKLDTKLRTVRMQKGIRKYNKRKK